MNFSKIQQNLYRNKLTFLLREYLEKLQFELDRYIPKNVELNKYSWVKNPFEITPHEDGDNIYGFQDTLLGPQAN